MDPLDRDARLLRDFLAERDVACPACRSNLRGLTASACPECGSPLRLSVSATGPRLGLWLVALLAAVIPLGFTGVLAVLAAAGAWRSQTWGDTPVEDAVFLGIATTVLAGALWFVIRRRSRFLARPWLDQCARATATVIFFGAIMVGILYVWVGLRA